MKKRNESAKAETVEATISKLTPEKKEVIFKTINALLEMQEHPETAPKGERERFTTALTAAGAAPDMIARVLSGMDL